MFLSTFFSGWNAAGQREQIQKRFNLVFPVKERGQRGRNTTTFTFCSTVISNVLKYVKSIQPRKQNSTKPNGDLSNIYLDLEEENPQEKLANEFVKNLSAEN